MTHFVVFAGFYLLGPAFHWAVQGRWFELADGELRSYKGERLLRAWPLSQVSRVEAERGAYYVVFADRSRVRISGEGGQELLDALRDHVRRVSPSTDSAAADPHLRSFVLRHLSFPGRCIRCGAPPAARWNLSTVRGMVFADTTTARVPVPVCGGCKWRRLLWGVVTQVAPFALVPPAFAALAIHYGEPLPLPALLFLDGVLAMVWLMFSAHRLVTRMLDARVLGVAVRSLSRDDGGVEMWFRSDLLLLEVAQLTTAAESRAG